MIGIYYTGAGIFEGEQRDPLRSLGGLISSTLVPNDFTNSLFSGLSDKDEHIGLVIRNETGADIPSLEIYFDYPNDGASPTPNDINKAKFLIGTATISTDPCGDLSIESLASRNAAPYTVTFIEAIDTNRLTVTNFDNEQYVGIFIKRQKILDPRTQDEINQECFDNFQANVAEIESESIDLIFSY